jgi:hypothetical protein
MTKTALNYKLLRDSPRVMGETCEARMDHVTYSVAQRRRRSKWWSRGTKTHFLQSLASQPKTWGSDFQLTVCNVVP